MTAALDLVQIARTVAAQEAAAAKGMIVDGTVVSVDVTARKASVQIGGPSAQPMPGFTYRPDTNLLPGDHVLVYRLGGYQLVLHVLNRHAVVGPAPYFWGHDYGTKGDGLTDDTVALGKARAAALVAGGSVALAPGTYSVSSYSVNVAESWVAPAGGVTVKRRAADTATTFVAVNALYQAERIVFDGDRANATVDHNIMVIGPGCARVLFRDCEFTGAKGAAVNGAGVLLSVPVVDTLADYRFDGCRFTNNDRQGLYAPNGIGMRVDNCSAVANGGAGFQVLNFDVTLASSANRLVFDGCVSLNNVDAGFIIGDLLQNNNPAVPVYGPANPDTARVVVTGCVAESNGSYGFAVAGWQVALSGCVARNNAAGSSIHGGYLFNASYSSMVGCIAANNGFFGIDAGGATVSILTGNVIVSNSNGAGGGMGCNLGATDTVLFAGNLLSNNGGSASPQVMVHRYEATGAGVGFPNQTKGLTIQGNLISLSGTQVGVFVRDGGSSLRIVDNHFKLAGTALANANYCIWLVAKSANVSGNIVSDTLNRTVVIASNVAAVPDVLEWAYCSGTGPINALAYYTAQTLVTPGGIAWCDITAGGTGYTTAPAVVITGDGTGAAATALIDSSGAVQGVRVSTFGTGYTTATVSFTGGGGTGAAATAQIGLPLVNDRRLELLFVSDVVLTRAGTPVVFTVDAADMPIKTGQVLGVRSAFGQWYIGTQPQWIALQGSATYDPPSLVDGAGATTTVTVGAAALGDFVDAVSFDKDLQGITVTAWVSAANTVAVRFQNETGGTLDLASGTLRARVRKA